MRHICLLVVLSCLVACEAGVEPAQGMVESENSRAMPEPWRLEFQLPDTVLPVTLYLGEDGDTAWFVNGAERVQVPEIHRDGSRLELLFPTFNNGFYLELQEDRLEGELTLLKRGYVQHIPISGERGLLHRFSVKPESTVNVTGRWEVLFTEDDGKQYPAVAELDQQGSEVTGTFLTPTGDYRYLQGEVEGQQLKLSTFDGSHAFVFIAEINGDGELVGDFWSGTHWHESWVGHRNFNATLPDPYALTYLNEGYDTLQFTFPDLEGSPVSLADNAYKDKVVLVTLSGTWCPNCADEAVFLSQYFAENRDRGLEIITLLYEHVESFEEAAEQGKRLRNEYDIDYQLLIAGSSDKDLAAETLPMLNRVLAFPTIIFIDRAGQVRRIHTGFSGPGTGAYYTEFVAEFEQILDELLNES
jgi:peroxiredoxin